MSSTVSNDSDVTSLRDVIPQMANLRAHWLAWGGSGAIQEDVVVSRRGPRHGLLKGVLRVRGRRVPEAAAEVEKQLADVPWRWWVGPDSDAGVAEALLERGYSRDGSMPVMAAPLD